VERLKDPAIRERLLVEMTTPTDQWESLYLDAGGAENVILIGFKNPELKSLTGKTVAEVAKLRGTSPEATMMDLVIEDHSPVSAVYFVMSEANIRKKIAQPWMSFGSDEASLLPEGAFLEFNPHPRAYGNFARLLGKYVRDEQIISLAEAIRKLTSLPAENLKIRDRGSLEEGFFADIVVFDPTAIQDHATYDEPHQLSTGVMHVFVNGEAVLRDGVHTGATPGRFVRGPGWSEEGVARVPSQIPKPGDWGPPKQILLKHRAPEPAWNANLPGTLDSPGQVVYFNGKYRLYYLAGDGNCSLSCDHYAGNENRSLGMMTADDPAGPWTEYGTAPLIKWSPNQCPEEGIFSLATIVDGPTLYLYYGAMTASDVQTPMCKSVSAGVRVAQTTDGFTFTGDIPVPLMDGAASAEPTCTGCVLGDDDAEVYPVSGFKRASDGEFVLYYVSDRNRNLYVTHGPAYNDLGANSASDVAISGYYGKQMSLVREDSDTFWMFLVQETGAPVRTIEVYRLEDAAPQTPGILLESYDENDGIAESITSTIYRGDTSWIWLALGCSDCVCHSGLDGNNYGDACFFDEYTVRSAKRADARNGVH